MKHKKRWIAMACVVLLLVSVFAGCADETKSEKYAAKINGVAITRPIFVSLFKVQLSLLYEEAPENLSFEKLGTAGFVDVLKETKNAQGQSYYDQLIEQTLEECQTLIANIDLAKKNDAWKSEADLEKEQQEELESIELEATQYGIEDVDLYYITNNGIPVKDYVAFATISQLLSAFNTEEMEKIEVDETDLRAYYDAHEADYESLRIRTVRVRHSLFNTEELSEGEKQAVLTKVQGYVEAYRNQSMTMDEIVALSEDPGVTTNDGYYDVTEDANFVEAFKDWALSQETVTDTIEIVETEYGYHVMQCTKIWVPDFEDEAVHDTVKMNFQVELLEKDLKDRAKDDAYAIKDRHNDVIESFVTQMLSGNFEGSTSVEPAEPQEPDAAASDDAVATLGEAQLWKSDYTYFFNTALYEIVQPDYTPSDEDLSEKEQVEALRAFLDQPYKDEGVTYLQRCKDRALELQVQFIITYNQAVKEEFALTDDEVTELNSEIDSLIDQYLSYYGASFGVTTRDEMCNYIANMNVNEYKRLSLSQALVSEFAEKKQEAMKPTESVLKDYYNANVDQFRVVTVRRIFLSLVDGNGEAVSAEEKAAIKKKADALIVRIQAGDTPELLVQMWSEDPDAEYDAGLVDLTADSTAMDEAIVAWTKTVTTIGKHTVKLFETEEGYEIVLVEGILDYEQQQGIAASEDSTVTNLQEAVETQYKNDEFQKLVDSYVAASALKVENVKQELIDQVVEGYLTYPTDDQ